MPSHHPHSFSSSSSSSSMDAQGAGSSANVFQMPHIPALRFPSPPPPPPPQVPSTYSRSYASPYPRHHPSITSLPILVLTVLGILTATVLLLTYYVVVVRCCLSWHGSSDAGGGGATASSSSRPVPAETRGLEESTVHALPAFRYSNKAVKSAAAAADSAPASECAVCLSEFEEDERVRMLPSCLHAFHVDCIDAWLHGNANCPLCRSSITFTAPCIVPLDQQLRRPDEAVIQVAATRTEVGVLANNIVQTQQRDASIAAAEPAGDTITTTAQQVTSDDTKRNNAWRDVEISSEEDERAAVNKDRDVLPLRRSSSMGSQSQLGGDEVRLRIHNILQRNAHTHLHRDDTGTSTRSAV